MSVVHACSCGAFMAGFTLFAFAGSAKEGAWDLYEGCFKGLFVADSDFWKQPQHLMVLWVVNGVRRWRSLASASAEKLQDLELREKVFQLRHRVRVTRSLFHLWCAGGRWTPFSGTFPPTVSRDRCTLAFESP